MAPMMHNDSVDGANDITLFASDQYYLNEITKTSVHKQINLSLAESEARRLTGSLG